MNTIKAFILFITITLAGGAFLFSDEVIDIGALNRNNTEQILPITIECNNSRLMNLVQTAFNTHGGYVQVAPNKSVFTFRFSQIDNNAVSVAVLSGDPQKTLYTENFKGKNWQQAALKAADGVVQRTLGIPGYFAGKIAFVGERNNKTEVYTGDLFFLNVRQLTSDRAEVSFPRFSPNGREMLFTSYYKTGFPDIFLVDLVSGERRPFANYEGSNTGATFSPDGKSVAMILSSSGNPELYISDNKGRSPRRVTNTKDLESSPTWSPDGSQIIIASDPLGSPQLYKVSLFDGSMTRIQTNISRYCAEPAWNPNNKNQIAFTTAISKAFQTAVYDFSKGSTAILTKGSDDFIEPCWLNDGRHLIVTRRAGEVLGLNILDSKTGKITPLHSRDFGNARMADFIY